MKVRKSTLLVDRDLIKLSANRTGGTLTFVFVKVLHELLHAWPRFQEDGTYDDTAGTPLDFPSLVLLDQRLGTAWNFLLLVAWCVGLEATFLQLSHMPPMTQVQPRWHCETRNCTISIVG